VTKRNYGNKGTRRGTSNVSPVYRGRRFALMLVLLVGIAVLLGRAAYLEIFQQDWLKKQAGKRQLRTVLVPPYRGMIIDRNGESLAISSPAASITINPRKVLKLQKDLQKMSMSQDAVEAEVAKSNLSTLHENLGKIETILGMSPGALQEKLQGLSGKSFYYLARQLEPEKAQEISDLNVPGLYAAGDMRIQAAKQVVCAASDGAIAGMQALEHILEQA